MTEDRFWELAEGGARLLVLGVQWALIWPFVLLGILASAIEAPSGVETGNTDSTEGESAVAKPVAPKASA